MAAASNACAGAGVVSGVGVAKGQENLHPKCKYTSKDGRFAIGAAKKRADYFIELFFSRITTKKDEPEILSMALYRELYAQKKIIAAEITIFSLISRAFKSKIAQKTTTITSLQDLSILCRADILNLYRKIHAFEVKQHGILNTTLEEKKFEEKKKVGSVWEAREVAGRTRLQYPTEVDQAVVDAFEDHGMKSIGTFYVKNNEFREFIYIRNKEGIDYYFFTIFDDEKNKERTGTLSFQGNNETISYSDGEI